MLIRALDSIRAQEHIGLNIEIIAVNDGSTDNSLEVLENYKNRCDYLTIISQTNQKLPTARNNGLDKASGDYIYFMDSDDYLTPDAFYPILCKAQESNADITKFGVVFSSDNEYIETNQFDSNAKWKETTGKEYLQRTQAYAMDGAVWRVFFKRSFLKSIGAKFKKVIFSEDNLFFLQVLPYCKKMIETDATVYHYWQSAQSMVGVRNQKPATVQIEIEINWITALWKLLMEKENQAEFDKDISNTLRYILNLKTFNIISLAYKANLNLPNLFKRLKSLNLYPLNPISEFKSTQSYYQPFVKLKWSVFRHPKLTSILQTLKVPLNR